MDKSEKTRLKQLFKNEEATMMVASRNFLLQLPRYLKELTRPGSQSCAFYYYWQNVSIHFFRNELCEDLKF